MSSGSEPLPRNAAPTQVKNPSDDPVQTSAAAPRETIPASVSYAMPPASPVCVKRTPEVHLPAVVVTLKRFGPQAPSVWSVYRDLRAQVRSTAITAISA